MNSSSVQPWSLRMPSGSAQSWTFTFTTTAPGGFTPYPLTGSTWEYVARVSQTDTTSPPAIKITTTPSSQGLITVTSTATLAQVLLQIYPAATAIGTLTPGTLWHALWMNPGTTTETAIFGGLQSLLLVEGTPEP